MEVCCYNSVFFFFFNYKEASLRDELKHFHFGKAPGTFLLNCSAILLWFYKQEIAHFSYTTQQTTNT